MPLPAGFFVPVWTMALPLATRGAGEYASVAFVNDFTTLPTSDVELLVYASAVTPAGTLDCALMTSPDGAAWSPVPGGATPRLASAGSAASNASIASGAYVQLITTVGGSGDASVTYRAIALIFAQTS